MNRQARPEEPQSRPANASELRGDDKLAFYDAKRSLLRMMVGCDLTESEQRKLIMETSDLRRDAAWIIRLAEYAAGRDDISHRWIIWALKYPDKADRIMNGDWKEQENDDEDAERYLDGIEDPDAGR